MLPFFHSRRPSQTRARQRGQVIAIFAGALLLFTLLAATVIDLSWYWTNNLRMQRAADAAALAGVVFLPGDTTSAYAAARAEAAKNGFSDGVDGVVVTPAQDTTNPRRLKVRISGPIGTYFARVVGINSWPAQRDAKADYVLPVPMGSPENYYGVFGMTRGLTSSEEVTTINDVDESRATGGCSNTSTWPSNCDGARPPSSGTYSSGTWAPTAGSLTASVRSDDNVFARTPSSGNGVTSTWWNLGLLGDIYDPPSGESVDSFAIQVRVRDAYINSACSGGSARIGVRLSRDGGGSWSNQQTTGQLSAGNSNTDNYYDVGLLSNSSGWGGPAWTRSDFSDSQFRVELSGVETCTGDKQFSVDRLEVRVYYTRHYQTTTTSTVTTNLTDKLLQGPGSACTSGKANCFEADGPTLNPRGFWGTLNTQGAENINGDAFQPNYDRATSQVAPSCSSASAGRACYDATNYYNYGVEIPAGASGGAIYIYDPVFCDVDQGRGTGDRWFSGNNAVSTFYTVYDTKNTLSNMADDGAPIAASDGEFRNIDADDSSMGGSGGASGSAGECMYLKSATYGDGRDYHNRWYLLASGLQGGKTYRVHTSSTDPANASAQRNTNGENSFAIFATASTGTPRVYGIGAMQAFTPLTASGSQVSSEFYLAQVEAVHAGKTVEIHLWDPGDTNPLQATLQILIPTSSGWTTTNFSYSASVGTANSNAASCGSQNGTNVSSVQTNAGATSGTYNGCWLVIRAVIPQSYTAEQDGWWKIRYLMNGNGTSNDVTTWTVNIVGNPVHLVLP